MNFDFNNINSLSFNGVMICWIVFAAIFLLRKRPPQRQEQKRDRTALIGITLQAIAYAMVWTFRRLPFTPMIPISPVVDSIVATIAVVLAVVSVWLVMSAVKTLGKQWSVSARMVEGHELVTEGPYRIVRNPIYTGMMGMMIATGFVVSKWIVVPIAIVIFIIGTLIRVRTEEKLLREMFGAAFDEYARRVPSFVPGIHS